MDNRQRTTDIGLGGPTTNHEQRITNNWPLEIACDLEGLIQPFPFRDHPASGEGVAEDGDENASFGQGVRMV